MRVGYISLILSTIIMVILSLAIEMPNVPPMNLITANCHRICCRSVTFVALLLLPRQKRFWRNVQGEHKVTLIDHNKK